MSKLKRTFRTVQIPDYVHKALKIKAALSGITIHEYLEKALQAYSPEDIEGSQNVASNNHD